MKNCVSIMNCVWHNELVFVCNGRKEVRGGGGTKSNFRLIKTLNQGANGDATSIFVVGKFFLMWMQNET